MAFPHGASAEGGRPTILFFPLVDYDLGVVLLFWAGSAPAHFDLLIEQGPQYRCFLGQFGGQILLLSDVLLHVVELNEGELLLGGLLEGSLRARFGPSPRTRTANEFPPAFPDGELPLD